MEDYLYKDLTYKIIGCAYKVHRELGSVHKEIVYQRALAKEFIDCGLKFEREKILEVRYSEVKVGVYKPDFLIEEKVILEIKALGFLPKNSEIQLSYYLRGSGYKIGLLVNFGMQSLEVKRRIYDKV